MLLAPPNMFMKLLPLNGIISILYTTLGSKATTIPGVTLDGGDAYFNLLSISKTSFNYASLSSKQDCRASKLLFELLEYEPFSSKQSRREFACSNDGNVNILRPTNVGPFLTVNAASILIKTDRQYLRRDVLNLFR
jgi:hypothetical protein